MMNRADANAITREYFDSLLIAMRHLDNVKPSTAMELYGHHLDTPIMTTAFYAHETNTSRCRSGAGRSGANSAVSKEYRGF